jgi:hypothetical protein
MSFIILPEEQKRSHEEQNRFMLTAAENNHVMYSKNLYLHQNLDAAIRGSDFVWLGH